MSRMKPSWYYQRQATEAQARETYFRTRPAPVTDNVVIQRASTTAYYRSMLRRTGADPAIIQVQVDNDALTKIQGGLTPIGLLSTLPANTIAFPQRGSGITPTKASWHSGKATPTVRRTAWNTAWTEYYDTTAGRSHFSVPLSLATGEITAQALNTAFLAVFKPSGTASAAMLGAKNGRAQLTLEKGSTSVLT